MPKYKTGDVLIFPPKKYPSNKDQKLVILKVTAEEYVVERRYTSGRIDSRETYKFLHVDNCTELDVSEIELYVLNKLKESGYIQ